MKYSLLVLCICWFLFVEFILGHGQWWSLSSRSLEASLYSSFLVFPSPFMLLWLQSLSTFFILPPYGFGLYTMCILVIVGVATTVLLYYKDSRKFLILSPSLLLNHLTLWWCVVSPSPKGGSYSSYQSLLFLFLLFFIVGLLPLKCHIYVLISFEIILFYYYYFFENEIGLSPFFSKNKNLNAIWYEFS